nr:hypothetical protein [Tanacetum cinerariifolium]
GFGAGLILIAPHDVEYSYALRLNFSNSNNDDEYEALLDGIRIATEMQLKDIHAFVDSKLVASKVVAKAINMGYYWPSMHRDARELIRACDDCQAHASVGPGRVKYLIVATNYFTKWMKVKPLATITGRQVVNFTWDNIVCKFGIPATIIRDNKTQFVNDPFKK